ncbi:MAG: N-acetylmuramoyl-L-alanine amidase, partial [Coprobacter sp.]|nr:N-acetylmuramoyl-L-alanine amidase [Coprobacter sp.]
MLLAVLSLASGVQAKDDKFVLVIDAGHGGKDPGALGSRFKEKDINLAIALKFGALVQSSHPDVKVVYTRKNDNFVELQERAAIANRAKADLFVSVHTNSAVSKAAYGTETYTLGLARTEENLRVAKRENAVILLEDDFSARYEGFDPNSTESYIMFEFMQDRHMEQSINLASVIQKQFTSHAKRTDRGVRQAGFLVLRNTGMPSVLIEVGYISNAAEETFLGSADGQQKMASSIYNAFCEYKADADRKAGRAIAAVQPTQPTPPTQPAQTPAKPAQTPAKPAQT